MKPPQQGARTFEEVQIKEEKAQNEEKEALNIVEIKQEAQNEEREALDIVEKQIGKNQTMTTEEEAHLEEQIVNMREGRNV